MASLAAIYTVERFVRTPEEILPASVGRREAVTRPRPEHKRVWASLAHSPEKVITAMFDEAAHRDPRGKKRWVALVDGNLTQIDLLEQLAKERKISLPIVVDFIHGAHYVCEAALGLIPDNQPEQDRWVRAQN